MSENFLFARTVLTNELNNIGGKIFADKLLRLMAEHGNDDAKKSVDAQDLFMKIMSRSSTETEAERNLCELVDAIQVLHRNGKGTCKQEAKDSFKEG